MPRKIKPIDFTCSAPKSSFKDEVKPPMPKYSTDEYVDYNRKSNGLAFQGRLIDKNLDAMFKTPGSDVKSKLNTAINRSKKSKKK
jgi:hypothetical protein